MQINLSGIPIEIKKKNIKNMHLSVKPPNGSVVISAPTYMSNKAIEMFARTKLGWIKNQIKKYEEQPRSAKKQYVSGETLYIWGEQYFLEFRENRNKNIFEMHGNKVILGMRSETTVAMREAFVREQYRLLLKQEIEILLPKWEKITGLKCDSWQTKYMTTRWGSCNTDKKRLWFNVQLAQKPLECLEYVILHELVHTVVKNHGEDFIAYMDKYMVLWRDVQKLLNTQKLDYLQNEIAIK